MLQKLRALSILIYIISLSLNAAPPSQQSVSILHYLLGELAVHDEDAQKASEYFRYARNFDPSSSELAIKEAEQLLNLGKTAEAKALLVSLPKEESIESAIILSRISAAEFDLDAALKHFDVAISLIKKEGDDKRLREITLSRVALLSDYRKYQEAVETLNGYLAENSQDEIAFYFKGKLHSILQNSEASKKAYLRALDIRPNFSAALKALGLQFELEGKTKEAITYYESALASSETDLALKQKLVNLYLLNENFSGALQLLKSLIIENPDDVDNQMKTALLYYKTKQFKEAKQLFALMLQNSKADRSRVYFYLGVVHEELKETTQALNVYLGIEPTSEYFVQARLQCAQIYSEQLQDEHKSIETLKVGLLHKPKDRDLILALAQSYESQEQLPEAVRILSQAEKDYSEDERVLFLLGTYLDRSGDYEGGIVKMKQVLKINQDNAFALNHIGYVYAERKMNLGEAKEMLHRAVQLKPDNGYILDSLGWTYYQSGEFEKARSFLEKANQLTQNEPLILEHLADAYRKTGREKDARALYKDIIKFTVQRAQDKKSSSLSHGHQEVEKRIRSKLASMDAGENF